MLISLTNKRCVSHVDGYDVIGQRLEVSAQFSCNLGRVKVTFFHGLRPDGFERVLRPALERNE